MDEKMKIVMIDDETDLCLLVKDNLEDTGKFTVVTCSEPKQAETYIHDEHPDLILLDEVMPSRKGEEIVKNIKKDKAMGAIPIIMISGKGEMVYQKRSDSYKWKPNTDLVKKRGDLPETKSAEGLAEAYGVDEYISKPFTSDILIEVVESLIKKRKKQTENTEEDQLI